MNNYIAFKDGEVLMESGQWEDSHHLPPGCYIRFVNIRQETLWYFTMSNRYGTDARGINHADVPDWVRTWCLIL